jgi:hypothetical protein
MMGWYDIARAAASADSDLETQLAAANAALADAVRQRDEAVKTARTLANWLISITKDAFVEGWVRALDLPANVNPLNDDHLRARLEVDWLTAPSNQRSLDTAHDTLGALATPPAAQGDGESEGEG